MTVSVAKNVRMADFASWIVAAESAGVFPWNPGEFLAVYARNRQEVSRSGVESDALAAEIVRVLDSNPGEAISGTPSELALRFEHALTGRSSRLPSPREFSDRLKRILPQLASVGIEARHHRSRGIRQWEIRRFRIESDSPEDSE